MTQMVELLRNPAHFKIDELSPRATSYLKNMGPETSVERKRFGEVLFPEEFPHIHELVSHGFLEYRKEKRPWESDAGKIVILDRTFDGWEASEHLRCGYYQHAKAIYAEREARDAALEENPLWCAF
jgi:hypothetical protein